MARIAICLLLAALTLPAQVPVSGAITDPSDAAVGGATVRLRQGQTELSAVSTIAGQFLFEQVPPGQYELLVEVADFEPVRRRVRVQNRPLSGVDIRLKLAPLKEEVTITGGGNQLSLHADRSLDSISVERTMLDNLPALDNNYLNTLARFLGPGTPGDSGPSLVVDGMESRNVGVTPSAIQEIRINNNPYTVEYPRWSRRRIEVITKTAADAYHGTFNFLFRDSQFNARDSFAAVRPPEQRRMMEGSLFGPIGNSKDTSFLFSGAREEENLVAFIFAQGLQGTIRENLPAPQRNSVASLRVSHQLDQKQAMFFQLNFQDRWQNNLGAGGTTLPEAGFRSRFREDELIFNHRATISTSLLSQFRILLGRFWAPTNSNLDAPRLTVTDAFTGGGAQADRLATELHTSITWLLTHTVRRHTLKYGVNVPDWSRRGLRDETNRLGAFSYATLADFAARRPFAAVLQQGDPYAIFIEKNLGWFVQDEWQFRKNLSVSPGLRYDWQNYFGDRNNLSPRLAIAYAPGKQRNWVIRTGAGLFYDRSGPVPIWDILRYNGVRLRRYVLGPAQISTDPATLAPSLHRLEPEVELPGVAQFSAGLERQLFKKSMLAIGYVGTRAVKQFRSRDANAPLPPSFSSRPVRTVNVLRLIESAGRMEGNALEISVRGDIAPRVTGMVQYVFSKTSSDTGGLNWFPADSFAPRGEWGRADSDRRHQFNFLGTAALHRWANFGISAFALTGLPYNITTGRDDNGDGMPQDRPAGVTRNTGQGPGWVGMDLRWFRELRLNPSLKEKSSSVTLSVDAFNVLNRVNFQSYIGALTSPFFGRAVAAQPSRRLQLGLRFQF
ncbi:MAG: TonB-dependent receptor [Acidimicrobiia bacterium]|nr:TonB-dependent receptor [Acidimicrobiia bacterium]